MEEIELNKIYNEDCLEGMRRIPDGIVDLVVTDPPYCIGTTSNGKKGDGVTIISLGLFLTHISKN